MTVDNILDTLRRATPDQVREGQAWYRTARAFTDGVANRYGVHPDQAAYALAALSPQQSWGSNQRSLVLLLDTGSTYGLGANIGKARRILAGEPPSTVLAPPNPKRVTGNKVRAFAECIIAAGRTSTVCVDRHAADIALGRPVDATPLPSGFLTDARYRTIAQAYRLAAQRSGGRFTACEVQAITWLVRRADKHPTNPTAFD